MMMRIVVLATSVLALVSTACVEEAPLPRFGLMPVEALCADAPRAPEDPSVPLVADGDLQASGDDAPPAPPRLSHTVVIGRGGDDYLDPDRRVPRTYVAYADAPFDAPSYYGGFGFGYGFGHRYRMRGPSWGMARSSRGSPGPGAHAVAAGGSWGGASRGGVGSGGGGHRSSGGGHGHGRR